MCYTKRDYGKEERSGEERREELRKQREEEVRKARKRFADRDRTLVKS